MSKPGHATRSDRQNDATSYYAGLGQELHDNQAVKKGDVLFRIDPARFQIALRDAQANVDSKLAAAQEADRETTRFNRLNALSVSEEQQQQRGSVASEAQAAYQQALASRDVAALNLARSLVQASVNGFVTNFDIRPGDYIDAGKPVFALIDSDSLHVEGYFEETKLARIKIGDPARVYLVGENAVIDGHVEAVAGDIADRERQGSADLLANVNPTFSWGRNACRFESRSITCPPTCVSSPAAPQLSWSRHARTVKVDFSVLIPPATCRRAHE